MNIGLGIFSGVEVEEMVRCFKKLGVSRTFIHSEKENFECVMKLFKENGIICETLHAPYNKINDMWKEGDEGEEMLGRLIDCVDKCEKHNVPVMIVHVSSGRPMAEMTQIGFERYDRLVDYAREKNIKVAFENLRYFENLDAIMKRYPDQGFCWDTGHNFCCHQGFDFMKLFGKRLIALHINDNSGDFDADEHVLPFDGGFDFEKGAKSLAENGFKGTIMLEVSKNSTLRGEKLYAHLTDEEYIERAANSAKKIADMVENYAV